MKNTVIYHRADFDGIFCREIARRFLPDAELIGWDYGDPKIGFPTEGTVYVLDLSPECFGEFGAFELNRLIWTFNEIIAELAQASSKKGADILKRIGINWS